MMNFRAFLTAAATGLVMTFAAGTASAQAPTINCALDANAGRPECLGRGKGGIVAPGTVNTAPGTRSNIVDPTASGNTMIDCQLDVNAGRPECLGRGKGGIVAPGSANTAAGTRANTVDTTGAVPGERLVNCQLDVNAGRPECLGRGKGGLVAPGTPAPANR